MLHTKLRGILPTCSGEKIFLTGCLGRGGHLGHVTSIMSSDFHFLVPESFHTILVQISTVLRKSKSNFYMYTTLGQGQEIALTFNTHISSYIQLDVCSY